MKTIHLILAGFVLCLSSCNSNRADMLNTNASLPSSFGFSKLHLKVINSSINKKQQTMSTLYSNDMALNTAIAGSNEIRSGEVFELVTWKQKEDEHWFGANIPGGLQSVEEIKVTPSSEGGVKVNYQRFEGAQLKLNTDTTGESARISYIFNQQASVMP